MSDSSLGRKVGRVVARQHRKSGADEIAVSVFCEKTGETVHAAAGQQVGGPVDAQTPFFLASTTKLFATALVLQLRSEGLLELDEPITRYLGAATLSGLHRIGGRDFSGEITVRHLLSHTSGLPDYFEEKRRDGSRLATSLLAGTDARWSLDDVLAATRHDLAPHFRPGEARKALYSDTNHQLLGGVIESVTDQPLAQLVKVRIADRLALTRTYLFDADTASTRPAVLPLRNSASRPAIPQAIESTRLDGGGVSSSAELLEFIRAFFDGRLFPAEDVPALFDWRAVFFPLQYGVGVMRLKLPWFFSPFAPQPELVGHSGISGAFAFWSPEKRVFLSGTVNQLANRSLPYRFMLQVLAAVEPA